MGNGYHLCPGDYLSSPRHLHFAGVAVLCRLEGDIVHQQECKGRRPRGIDLVLPGHPGSIQFRLHRPLRPVSHLHPGVHVYMDPLHAGPQGRDRGYQPIHECSSHPIDIHRIRDQSSGFSRFPARPSRVRRRRERAVAVHRIPHRAERRVAVYLGEVALEGTGSFPR